MRNYTAIYDKVKDEFLLDPPQDRNPKELKNFGARWVPKLKRWAIPARVQELEYLEKHGILVDVPADWAEQAAKTDRLTNYLQEAQEIQKDVQHKDWAKLMPHQRVAVAYLASRPRALLSLTPGLGKSATSIIAADLIQAKKILVVAPLTLHKTWEFEIALWSEDPAVNRVDGKSEPQRWQVINPEKLLSAKHQKTVMQRFDLVIFDESILYKNRNAKRSVKAVEVASRAKHVWLLSGSPIAAWADDLFMQMKILRPDAFRSYWRFAEHWCALERTPWATEVVGNINPEGLRSYLRDMMFSRTPDDVPGVLPDTMQEVVHVELDKKQQKLYNEIKADLSYTSDDGETTEIPALIAQLTRLSQALSCPRILGVDTLGGKFAALSQMLKDEILPAGQKLVWVWFRETAEAYADALRDQGYEVAVIHGGTKVSEREELLEQFQAGELDLLIMQLQTGKFGLSLTEAKAVIYVDRSFSFDDDVQSKARVRRISSRGRVVPTFILHGGGTDNLVDVILSRKLKSATSLGLSEISKLI